MSPSEEIIENLLTDDSIDAEVILKLLCGFGRVNNPSNASRIKDCYLVDDHICFKGFCSCGGYPCVHFLAALRESVEGDDEVKMRMISIARNYTS